MLETTIHAGTGTTHAEIRDIASRIEGGLIEALNCFADVTISIYPEDAGGVVVIKLTPGVLHRKK